MLLCFHKTAEVHDPFAVQVMKAGVTVEGPKAVINKCLQTTTTNTTAIHNLHINL